MTAPSETPCFESLVVGFAIPTIERGPISVAHIFRWSAAIENLHRIHYDWRYATTHDGLEDVVINGSWKQHLLVELLSSWAGPLGWLAGLKLQFRAPNYANETLVAWGKVSQLDETNGHGQVTLEVGISNGAGVIGTIGSAIVMMPLRGGESVPYPFEAI